MDPRFEQLKESLELAVDGMSGEQLSRHLPGKWCAGQVLEHLYLTYTGTIRGFERVLTTGKPLATRASVAQRVLALVVVGLGHMPAGRKTPAVAEPRGVSPEKVRNELGAKLAAMDAILAECEARFGGRAKLLDHPILGPLTVRQWRKLHLVHGRHHHKQLLRLRESAGTHSGRRQIWYWGVTSVLALQCVAGGIMGALRVEPFLGVMRHLGYPDYFMTILGLSYVLAGLVLLAPGVPRLKEWASAGLIFNYTGAALSHLAAGDGPETLIGPIIFGILTIASWRLRPARGKPIRTTRHG